MIVLPMAGLSSRFSKAGYTLPKYMLPLGDGSMLQQVVKGFSSELQRQPFLFICRDVADTEAFITREMEALPEAPREVRIVVLDAETAGQAETVYAGLAAAGVADATPLTIFNIDSQHRAFSYPTEFNIEEVDGYLEVFRAEGTHWSFVRPDTGSEKPGAVAEVAEKLRISDLCSSGLYHFRRAGLFRELFEATLADDPSTLQGGERYVAPLYNLALARGCDIRFAEIPRDAIAFTGTPDEYEALRRQDGPKA